MSTKNPVVSYFHNPLFGTYYYGLGHPMKPFRISLVQELVLSYGLYKHLKIYQPRDAHFEDMCVFHSREYIRFLHSISPENTHKFVKDLERFNVGVDSPVFPGLYDYCSTSAGGSLAGAVHLAAGMTDVSINWMGGLHHAKMAESSGFCYVNDIVLAILELLKVHSRVLYIDIDIHHGDGVEEAFYTTDRVFTVSFHKYGQDFFPGTGSMQDVGAQRGEGYALNIPLDDAITDDAYLSIFKPVIKAVMAHYRPGAVVMQCGADSLAGDRLGCFNLTLRGHGEALRYVQSFNVPLLVLGGGGYTLRNVAKCWTYETAILCGQRLSEEIPHNAYYEYFAPDFMLPILKINMEDQNPSDKLEAKLKMVYEQLRRLPDAPGIQHGIIPPKLAEVDSSALFSKYSDYANGLPEDNPNVEEESPDEPRVSSIGIRSGDEDMEGEEI
eukprot:gnl/Dysnectes_brevis/3380_a4252_1009.p1 GENE.gnl/Dysnectes_brevis/3380_a4252_1009~~gnl/Dysnectes_brevis/3380_a4252_1009.p1  ORF type:complete len:440 (+),score=103.30 gnl/Dysnectes_brevis/3380_a4252_1009:105-1424(+)